VFQPLKCPEIAHEEVDRLWKLHLWLFFFFLFFFFLFFCLGLSLFGHLHLLLLLFHLVPAALVHGLLELSPASVDAGPLGAPPRVDVRKVIGLGRAGLDRRIVEHRAQTAKELGVDELAGALKIEERLKLGEVTPYAYCEYCKAERFLK
jgi:hypothetical protein